MDFIIGGLAGATTSILTNPLDVVKIRLQLQGELQNSSKIKQTYKGTLQAMYVIAKSDGLLALQKGLFPAMLLGFVVNGVSFGMYNKCELKDHTRKESIECSLEKEIFWSAVGGYLSGLCCNPILVVKTRLQAYAHPSIAVGKQYKYKSTFDGFRKIYKYEGVRAFFAGVSATTTRLALGRAAQLTSFSETKESLVSHGFFQSSSFILTIVASTVSSIVVVLVQCPFDVASVRLYNQGGAQKGKHLYTGMVDCLIKIYKAEGLQGWYKGIRPLYLKLAPNIAFPLIVWDLLNNLLGHNKIV